MENQLGIGADVSALIWPIPADPQNLIVCYQQRNMIAPDGLDFLINHKLINYSITKIVKLYIINFNIIELYGY